MSQRKVSTNLWMCLAPLAFSIAGVLSLYFSVAVVYPPDKQMLMWGIARLSSCSIPPLLASIYASYALLHGGWKFTKSWISVAMTAWIALLATPLGWFLILDTYFVIVLVSPIVFLLTGALMNGLWIALGNKEPDSLLKESN